MDQYTEAELAGLSEEERAAIMDSSDEEREALNAVINEGDDASGDGDSAAADDDEGATTGEAEDEGVSASAEDDDERPAFVPQYHAEPVADYENKIAALDKQFEEGEIEPAEYNKSRDSMVRAQIKAEISAEQNAQIEAQLWQREIADFMDDHKEYQTSKLRHAALDVAVKDLAANEANNDKPGRWFLREAHKLVQAEFGGQQKAEGKNEGDKQEGKPRKPDLSVVPKTLGSVPSADKGDAAGEFDHLEKLNDIDLERALARMSPEQNSRYMAA